MTRRAGPRAWLGFAVLGLPTLLVSIDVSVTGALLLTQVQATAAGLSLLVAAVSAVVLCAVAVCTLRLLGHVHPIGATRQHAAPPSPLELPVYGEAA